MDTVVVIIVGVVLVVEVVIVTSPGFLILRLGLPSAHH